MPPPADEHPAPEDGPEMNERAEEIAEEIVASDHQRPAVPDRRTMWRGDEESARRSLPPSPAAPRGSLWRNDEGTTGRAAPVATASRPAEMREGSMWRSDEGVPAAATRLAPPPPRERGTALAVKPSDGNGASADDDAATEPARKRRKRHERSRSVPRRAMHVLVAVVALALVAAAGDIAYTAFRLNGTLKDARGDLRAGANSFRDGDTDRSRERFESALAEAREAQALGGRPGWSLAEMVPLAGRDIDDVNALSQATELVARAGLKATKAGEVLGIDSAGLAGSIYRNGRVHFDTLSEGSPFIASAADLISRAADLLEDAPPPTFGFIQENLASAQNELESARDSAVGARTLVASLPSLLGADSERTYLLAFQALGESRGTGGVIGVYGLLKTVDGRLRLTEVAPYTDIFPSKPFDPVDAPDWFKENYGPQSALIQWPQANLSPNFPPVAKVILNMYEVFGGERLDGVLALDPVAMSHLMKGSAPIKVPQLDHPITSENVAKVLLHDSYVEFPKRKDQNEFLEEVVSRFWKRISSGNVDGPELTQALAEAAQTQHLKIYARDEDDQAAMAELGVDGSYQRAGPNVQVVFGNNYSANKVDYYLRRSIDTTIQLEGSGAARARTKVTLENRAPAGPPSTLLGPHVDGVKAGLNRTLLSILFPKGARAVSLSTNGDSGTPFEYSDDGYPVAWNVLDIAPGERSKMTLDYVIPDAARISPDGGELEFTLFPQTTYRPDEFSIRIAPPPGYSVASEDEDASLVDGYVYITGTLDRPRPIMVTLSPL